MNIDQRISYAVSIKEAGDFLRSEYWQEYVETDDLLGELFSLADLIFEGITAKTGLDAAPKGGGSRRGGGSSSSSRKQDSSPRGSGDKPRFKDGSADATPNQIKAIKKMLDANDLPYDRSGVDFEGDSYDWDTITMDETQAFFDSLGK